MASVSASRRAEEGSQRNKRGALRGALPRQGHRRRMPPTRTSRSRLLRVQRGQRYVHNVGITSHIIRIEADPPGLASLSMLAIAYTSGGRARSAPPPLYLAGGRHVPSRTPLIPPVVAPLPVVADTLHVADTFRRGLHLYLRWCTAPNSRYYLAGGCLFCGHTTKLTLWHGSSNYI